MWDVKGMGCFNTRGEVAETGKPRVMACMEKIQKLNARYINVKILVSIKTEEHIT